MVQPIIQLVIATDIPESLAELESQFANVSTMQVVGTALSGEEALGLVKTFQPDIVLMDYDMPGLDGAETTRAILKEDPSAMVIMLSVVNDANDIRHAMRSGARDYLVKPLADGELLKTIDWLLNERREYARMQAFVGTLRKAYEALFTDDKPIPDNVVSYLEVQASENPHDRLVLETLAVAYARNRNWAKLSPMVDYLLQQEESGRLN